MSALKVGIVALALGLGGGAFFEGSRVKKALLLQRTEAKATAAAHDAVVDQDADLLVQADGGHGVADSSVMMAMGPEGSEAHGDSAPPAADDATAATDDDTTAARTTAAPTTAVPTTAAPNGAATTPPEEEPSKVQAPGTDTYPAAEPEQPRTRQTVLPVADPDEGAKKLAKIFGAMKSNDAAKVLAEMSDEEIQTILKHMSDRQAAQIIGAFPPARAALLSRVVLGNGGS